MSKTSPCERFLDRAQHMRYDPKFKNKAPDDLKARYPWADAWEHYTGRVSKKDFAAIATFRPLEEPDPDLWPSPRLLEMGYIPPKLHYAYPVRLLAIETYARANNCLHFTPTRKTRQDAFKLEVDIVSTIFRAVAELEATLNISLDAAPVHNELYPVVSFFDNWTPPKKRLRLEKIRKVGEILGHADCWPLWFLDYRSN